MILPDVNVLVYAHREEAADHESYRRWLEETVNSERAYGMSPVVLRCYAFPVVERYGG